MMRKRMIEKAGVVAGEMLEATEGMSEEDEPLSEDNSRRHIVDGKVRVGFLEVRAWLQRMGLVDPVLNRFDTYTVPQASSREVAERLKEIADSMGRPNQ